MRLQNGENTVRLMEKMKQPVYVYLVLYYSDLVFSDVYFFVENPELLEFVLPVIVTPQRPRLAKQ